MQFPWVRRGWCWRRVWIWASVWILSAVSSTPPLARAAAAPAGNAARPNILFIMTDDHAAHAIGQYGSRINRTPFLDRLAMEGMRFNRCYAVNSICTPSRAAILTGRYSHKNGVPVFNAFDGNQPHVAKALQAAGYHTGMIGKWHLGSDPTGFDYWEILPGQGRYVNPVLYDRDGARVYPGYVTDVITDLGLAFLKNRPVDRPFFLMLHHKAPHREWTPDEKHRLQFAGREIPEPATLFDDYSGRTDALREQRQSVFRDLTRNDLKLRPPADLPVSERGRWNNTMPDEVTVTNAAGEVRTLRGRELDRWKYQRYMQDYLACVQSVDDNVGRVLEWLDVQGLRDNTIVVYTSDQGFFLGDHGMYDKRFFYEESARMPLLIRWPGRTKSGGTSDGLALNVDFAPTFLAAAGLPIPGEIQGKSLLPLFGGERPRDWRKSIYYRYYHDPGHHNTRAHYGVRTDTHKLIYFWKKDQWECYDLVRDAAEMHNIYSAPEAQVVVKQLKAELQRLRRELDDRDEFTQELPKDGVDGPPKKWKPGFGPGQ